jgi:methyl-accepting chemotaxis protein
MAVILAESPELEPILRAQNRLELTLVAAASCIFLCGVFMVTLLETHKTAGAALHVVRKLERLGEGRYTTRVNLRKDDNLRRIETAFNAMADALGRRAQRDAEALEQLAAAAERLEHRPEATALAAELRRLAEDQRRRAG